MATFGETIAAKRRELELSQRELAARVCKEDGTPISGQYLNDLEKDRRNPPSDYLIKQFAKELQIEEDALFVVAGSFPPDIEYQSIPPAQAVAAFKAFRKAIKND